VTYWAPLVGGGPALARRPQPLWRKLTLLALTILAIAGLLEAGTRLFTPLVAPLYVNHPVLGKTYVPGADETVYVPECDCRVRLRFNREGLRDRDRPYQKPPGVRRVALIGDSMIAAMATEEHNTAARLLEELLNAPGAAARWEVLNFGISGSSTGQELLMYREIAARYDPDIVLCAVYTGNDFGDNSRRLSSSRHRVYFDLDENGTLVQLERSAHRANFATWLNRHSRFYVWQKIAVKNLRDRARDHAGVLHGSQLVYWTEPGGAAAEAWTLLAELLRTMQLEVEARGGRLALAILPAAEQLYDEAWQTMLDLAGDRRERMDRHHPERRLRDICDDLGVPLATMLDEFRAASPHHSVAREEEWLHYKGSGHFNDAGNRLAAEILYRLLTAAGSPSEDRVAPAARRPAPASRSRSDTSTPRSRASRRAQSKTSASPTSWAATASSE